MSSARKVIVNSVLVGDELGQLKLINFNNNSKYNKRYIDNDSIDSSKDLSDDSSRSSSKFICSLPPSAKQAAHEIIRVVDDSCQQEPAATRAIISIRPISKINDNYIDTTDKPNSLFLIANRLGQIFICNTDEILSQTRHAHLGIKKEKFEREVSNSTCPILAPIYYNLNNKIQISGAQPINQTNILIIYKNGDIQHVDISQNVLHSVLQIKRKAINLLGLNYNSDAKAINWKIDGTTGQVIYGFRSSHVEENDPLTDMISSSSKKALKKKHQFALKYSESPCKTAQKFNETDRLVPAQVINMITSHDSYRTFFRISKWNSLTSLNMIYRKLALYDLIGLNSFDSKHETNTGPQLNCFKISENRLVVAGQKYTARVYDVLTQKSIYNCRFGSKRNPLPCGKRGDSDSVSDLEWLGGNKTTQSIPNMFASVSGADAIVKVFDLRSPKPVFNIDLTHETETCWQPYHGHPKGCQFTSISSSGAPYSTAIPSQQCVVGSKNGQLHVIDLRFPSKSYRRIGRINGFCGGEIRQIRFVSESFDTTRMISCASDRFVRINSFHTSFTSVISQKLTCRVFVSTKPTCIQPVCSDESYTSSLSSANSYGSCISTIESWT